MADLLNTQRKKFAIFRILVSALALTSFKVRFFIFTVMASTLFRFHTNIKISGTLEKPVRLTGDGPESGLLIPKNPNL